MVHTTRQFDLILEKVYLNKIYMKQRFLCLAIFVIFAIQLRGQENQYVVTFNHDTIYYIKVNENLGKKIVGHQSNGDKMVYNPDSVLYFFDGEQLRLLARKGVTKGWTKSGRKLIIVMRNKDGFSITDSPESTGTGYGMSTGPSMSVSTTVHNYYLFDNNGFIEKVSKENIESVISKYFNDCPQLNEEMKEMHSGKIFKKLYDLGVIYITNCAQEYNADVQWGSVTELKKKK